MDRDVPWVRVTPAGFAGQTCAEGPQAHPHRARSRMRWSVKPVRRAGKTRPASAADPYTPDRPVRLPLLQLPFFQLPFFQATRGHLAFADAGGAIPNPIQGAIPGPVPGSFRGGLPSLL